MIIIYFPTNGTLCVFLWHYSNSKWIVCFCGDLYCTELDLQGKFRVSNKNLVSLNIEEFWYRTSNVSIDIKEFWYRISNVSIDIEEFWYRTSNVSIDIKEFWYRTSNVSIDVKEFWYRTSNVSIDIEEFWYRTSTTSVAYCASTGNCVLCEY